MSYRANFWTTGVIVHRRPGDASNTATDVDTGETWPVPIKPEVAARSRIDGRIGGNKTAGRR